MLANKLHVRNFRCLRDVEIRLEPLTVLVGPNGSGKSTILRAMDPDLSFQSVDRWRRLDGGDFERRLQPLQTEERVAIGHRGKGKWRLTRLHLSLPATRTLNYVAEAHQLAEGGENLTNVFATLTRGTQARVSELLCQLVPLYADVSARPAHNGHHRVMFQDRWSTKIWYEPDEVSDGTMLLLALLTAVHSEPPPDILAIEEPEHSLHPYLLGEVIGMLRDLSTGKLGTAPVQVVLATHSAELLEFVEPREVRFVARNLTDGSTFVREAPVDSPEWESAYKEYAESLGEIWLAGAAGGVPGAPATR